MVPDNNLDQFCKNLNYDVCLIFVRHGQTIYNLEGKFQGQADGKLTDKGIEQSKNWGKSLKNIKFDIIYVSDLGRTKETFENLYKELDNKLEKINYVSILRERNSKSLTHKKIKDYNHILKNKNIDRRTLKMADEETCVEVNKRCEIFFNELLKKIDEVKKNKENEVIKIWAVSHGIFIMEFKNFINNKFHNIKPIFNNSTRNCEPNYFGIILNKDKLFCEKFNFENNINK